MYFVYPYTLKVKYIFSMKCIWYIALPLFYESFQTCNLHDLNYKTNSYVFICKTFLKLTVCIIKALTHRTEGLSLSQAVSLSVLSNRYPPASARVSLNAQLLRPSVSILERPHLCTSYTFLPISPSWHQPRAPARLLSFHLPLLWLRMWFQLFELISGQPLQQTPGNPFWFPRW